MSDIVVDLGDMDIEEALFEPMQKLLDQCKTAKVLSRLVFFATKSYLC
jgi:dynactin 1